MEKEYQITYINEDCLDLLIKEYEVQNGQRQQVGGNLRDCYNNIPHDREVLENMLPAEQWNQVLAVWGPEAKYNNPW